MAVSVNKDLGACEASGSEVGCLGGEPVSKEPDGIAKACGARVIGEELGELVAEDAGAAWLQKQEWQAGIDLRCHAIEDAGQIGMRIVEEAEVIKGASATDVSFRDVHAKARFGEEGFGSSERLRVVIVVPSVGPQHHHLRHLRWG